MTNISPDGAWRWNGTQWEPNAYGPGGQGSTTWGYGQGSASGQGPG